MIRHDHIATNGNSALATFLAERLKMIMNLRIRQQVFPSMRATSDEKDAKTRKDSIQTRKTRRLH